MAHNARALACFTFALVSVFALACGSSNNKDAQTIVTPAASAAARVATAAATQAAATTSAVGSPQAAASSAASAGVPEKVASRVDINGAGATFPFPLYSKWFDEYGKSVDPNVRINYQSIGSGGGIKQITEKTVDFGATDGFMNEEQLAAAPGILHIPMALGAVVPTYNLPGVTADLKFTPDVLADIFLGKITKWNDQRMKDNNAGVSLPDADITVVHRSDGSGTTYIWVDYLSNVSAEWKQKVGTATSVQWPAGVGGKGNEGVTGAVKQTPGSLGYVELIYAEQNKLPVGLVKNKAGQFVKANLDSVTAAAAGSATTAPNDLRFSIVNAGGDKSYPISGFTWLLVYDKQTDPVKAQAVTGFLWWALHDKQALSIQKDLLYAPVPPEIVTKAEKLIRGVTVNGQPALKLR